MEPGNPAGKVAAIPGRSKRTRPLRGPAMTRSASATPRLDDDFHAPVQALLIHRACDRRERPAAAKAARLDPIRIDLHVADEPRLHRDGAALAQRPIVARRAEGVGMAFNREISIRILEDELPELAQAVERLRSQLR